MENTEIDDLIAQVSGLEEVAGMYEVGADGAPVQVPFSRTAQEVWKRAPLGFGDATIAAGATATFSQKVSRPYRVDRVYIVVYPITGRIPGGIVGGAVIDSFQVGDREQLATRGVPAELYSPFASIDPETDNFEPSASALTFTLVVRNVATTSRRVGIGFKGSVKR